PAREYEVAADAALRLRQANAKAEQRRDVAAQLERVTHLVAHDHELRTAGELLADERHALEVETVAAGLETERHQSLHEIARGAVGIASSRLATTKRVVGERDEICAKLGGRNAVGRRRWRRRRRRVRSAAPAR